MLDCHAILRKVLAVAAGLLLSLVAAPAWGQGLSDYQVKAAYFYNFAKFVQWPAKDFADSTAPIRFCILRDRLFEEELTRIAKGKVIAGHATEVLQVEDAEQSRKCHALFINSAQERQGRRLVEALHGTSILTVGETEDFLQDGGMIAFVLDKDRVQFDINRKASSEAGLYISSKMLTLAKHVVE